ncbi:hypothetical protein W03_22100 [Nitrosomonas sp. PY1]|nr:hypothetical protein W03_22100 [Nitrosomonas sp. PY1]
MVSGCAFFSPPQSVPVIEDKVGRDIANPNDKRIGTLATVAQRRLAIVKYEDGKFCAEPPPDAADNIASSLSAALSGSSGNVEVQAKLATAVSSVAKQLFYRSQGLQLYRDGAFHLCNAYLNGQIDAAEYKTKYKELLESAEKLINAEIPHLANIKADTTGSPTPATPPELNNQQKDQKKESNTTAQSAPPITPTTGK